MGLSLWKRNGKKIERGFDAFCLKVSARTKIKANLSGKDKQGVNPIKPKILLNYITNDFSVISSNVCWLEKTLEWITNALAFQCQITENILKGYYRIGSRWKGGADKTTGNWNWRTFSFFFANKEPTSKKLLLYFEKKEKERFREEECSNPLKMLTELEPIL